MPTDEELKALKAENDKLKSENATLTSEKTQMEMERGIAEAQKAILLAHIPPSETKALDGKVTVDAASVTEVQKLAHEALLTGVKEMVKEIKKAYANLQTILLYNERDIAALSYYQAIRGEVELLQKAYDALLPPPPAAGAPADRVTHIIAMPLATVLPLTPALAGGIIKSVIDVLALFRTNTDIKGVPVTFDEVSLVAETAQVLRADFPTITILYSFPANTIMPNLGNPNPPHLLKSLQDLATRRQEAQLLVDEFATKSEEEKKSAAKTIAQAKALNATYDQLLTNMTAIGDQLGIAALRLLLRGEQLTENLVKPDSVILLVKAIGGGENLTKQNLWRSGRLYHSGTAILSYLLFDRESKLILSNVISHSTGFKESKLPE